MNIWAILSIIALILAYFLSLVYLKARFNKYSLFAFFCYMWIAILLLGSIQAYGLYEVSSKFYGLLFMGICSWIIGYFLIRYSRLVNYRVRFRTGSGRKDLDGEIIYNYNVRVMICYIIVITFFTILIAGRMIGFLATGLSLEQIHDIFLGRGDEGFFSLSFIDTAYSKIMIPCTYALIPVLIMMLFEREHFIISLIGLGLIMVYSFSSGGRIMLLYIIIDVMLCLGYYKITIPQKLRKKIIMIAILLVVAIVVITIIRRKLYVTGNYADLFDSFYTYITLCLPLGDYWISDVYANHHMTFGVSFLKGFLANVDYVFSKFGIHLLSNVLSNTSEIINMTEDNYIQIATSHRANAYVTWIYFFYLDFREFGVAIGSAIFGGITGFFEKNAVKKRSRITVAYYLLFAQCVIKSFVRWELTISAYFLAFIFIRFLFQKKHG